MSRVPTDAQEPIRLADPEQEKWEKLFPKIIADFEKNIAVINTLDVARATESIDNMSGRAIIALDRNIRSLGKRYSDDADKKRIIADVASSFKEAIRKILEAVDSQFDDQISRIHAHGVPMIVDPMTEIITRRFLRWRRDLLIVTHGQDTINWPNAAHQLTGTVMDAFGIRDYEKSNPALDHWMAQRNRQKERDKQADTPAVGRMNPERLKVIVL